VVALHGYGSSAEIFQRVGDRLAESGLLVALLEAPYAFQEDGQLGYDWTLYNKGADDALDQRAIRLLCTEFIPRAVRAVKDRYAVDRVYLLGFSQGAFVSLIVAIHNSEMFDGVVSFGLPAYETSWFDVAALEKGRRVRILLLHGSRDEIASPLISDSARDHLIAAKYPLTYRRFNGQHTVPDDQADVAARWILEDRR
jgi:phospholipase/carboxylesterase